jgi:hypothetical protein
MMNESEQLQTFVDNLLQEVIVCCDSDANGNFRLDEFTRIACEYLIESGEIDDVMICYHKARGMQVNAYNVNSDEDCLDLFVSVFNQVVPPSTVTKSVIDSAFKQAHNFATKALSGYHQSLEESSPAYDMAQRIHELRTQLSRIRLFLLTDGIVKADAGPIELQPGIEISLHIWDVQRMFRYANSGKVSEPIEIDFDREFGAKVSCLSLVDADSDYEGYLAVLPGDLLAKVYERFGARLLDRNVRAFLQARGSVNKGIRKTILEQPHRFFAYNNGITATADEIEILTAPDEPPRIGRVRNLQIVNGGQTTASLYHTAKKDKASLKGIYVQAKLSVIPPEHLDEIVPLISRYANSQNKVNDVQIQELSRSVWAPADSSQRQSKWFYERARGQYLDAKGREGTVAKKRQFELTYPPRQRFTKTDLAKFENTWMQLPHLVSLGAQKNFNHFSLRLKDRAKFECDVEHFEHLVAKAILFKTAEAVVGSQGYGGYRAQVVTYTVALLAHITSHRLDLDLIWRTQGLTPAMTEAIKSLSLEVHSVITHPPGSRNITEWCKRKECWDKISAIRASPMTSLEREFRGVETATANRRDKGIEPGEADAALTAKLTTLSSDTWFRISKWAKETGNLEGWQRSLSFSIGRLIASGLSISQKQALQAVKIMEEVRRLGFSFEIADE